jgi:rhodanese-related sulfurtransferase
MLPYTILDADELARWIKDKSINKRLIIMDVRDGEYEIGEGKILNCRNIPSEEFPNRVRILIDNLKSLKPKPNKIVFYCQLSFPFLFM